VAGDPTFNVGTGLSVTENDQIKDGASAGTVEVTGGGTLQLNNATNSYSGGTKVTGNSTLVITNNLDLGNTSGGLTLGDASSGGTLSTTTGLTSGRNITLGADGGTIDVAAAQTTTLQGTISGGELTKSGDGTLVLSVANTYSGGTVISGGTLKLGNAQRSAPAGST
jgi:autotransporter-associated beta strand protein